MKFLKRFIPFVLAIALYDLALFPGWLTPPSFKYSAEVQYSNELNSVEATYYRRARLLKTGQTTQYSSELDDGYYQKGITKSYTVLTTGTFADTVNIDLTHLVSTHIAFVKGTPNDSITSDTTNFTTLFVAGDVLVFSGSSAGGNNTNRTIAAGGVAAGTITLTSDNLQTSVVEGDSITIKKREAHSNACVLDNNTGLMWSQTVSGKMGVASDGKMPWTGQTYDIFAYCAAANVALLGGYGDWRVVNINEGFSLFIWEAPAAIVNATAFPGFPSSADYIWLNTTRPDATDNAMLLNQSYAPVANNPKTNTHYCLLVRGG